MNETPEPEYADMQKLHRTGFSRAARLQRPKWKRPRWIGWHSWELRIPIKEAGFSETPRVLTRQVIGNKVAAADELHRIHSEMAQYDKSRERRGAYRAFSINSFQNWNWNKVSRFLVSNGGCFGVAGPRGAGKTWLLHRSCEWANDTGGVGVYFPAPSAYDPTSFIVAITDAFCSTLERNLRPTGGMRELYSTLRRRLLRYCLPLILLGIALYLYHAGASHRPFDTLFTIRYFGRDLAFILFAIAALVAYYAILSTLISRRNARNVELRLRSTASEKRQGLRYALNRTENNEFGLNAGKGGITGSAKKARGRSYIERPITLASLVYDFRDIAQLASRLLNRPVVVAVDELDKISSLEEMRSLLRDVKGVFDIPGVSFLVSISDEALRCVQAGPITGRDEFSSAFYDIAIVEPLSAEEAELFVKDRTDGLTSPACATALLVLTCGNPREIVRLVGQISRNIFERDDARSAMRAVLHVEANELMERVISSDLPDNVKEQMANNVQRNWLESSKLPRYSVSESLWISNHGDNPKWRDLCEFWNRLLVRTWVAAELADVIKSDELKEDNPQDSVVSTGIDCVRFASYSAAWAREVAEAHSLFRNHALNRLKLRLVGRNGQIRLGHSQESVHTATVPRDR
jgi:KAP family P-loop domain